VKFNNNIGEDKAKKTIVGLPKNNIGEYHPNKNCGK